MLVVVGKSNGGGSGGGGGGGDGGGGGGTGSSRGKWRRRGRESLTPGLRSLARLFAWGPIAFDRAR